MAETGYNYIDAMNSNETLEYMSNQHDQAVELTGRKAYIFLLDKFETSLSDVYKEEKHGRVYLPHFVQRSIYKTNEWKSQLGVTNYTESEENLEMEFNFARMVNNIRSLKNNSSGILTIQNTSKIPLEIEISHKFIIRKFREIVFEKDIKGKVFKFVEEVNSETDLVKLSYSGDGEELYFLEKIYNKQILPRRKIELQLNNSIYRNASDVIDHGTIIVTDRMKAYQVVGAYPNNDAYSAYMIWKVQLELINMAKIDGLPNDYAELIKKNQYGLTSKYNIG